MLCMLDYCTDIIVLVHSAVVAYFSVVCMIVLPSEVKATYHAITEALTCQAVAVISFDSNRVFLVLDI